MRGRHLLALGLVGSACFSGDGTLGSFCRDDSDCGSDQACESNVCGRCGDGQAQAGELCLRIAERDVAPVPATSLHAATPSPGGDPVLVAAAEGATSLTVLTPTSGAALESMDLALPGPVVAIAVGDLEGDGDDDLALAMTSPPGVLVALAEGGAWTIDEGALVKLQAAPTDVAILPAGSEAPGRVAVIDAAGTLATLEQGADGLSEPTSTSVGEGAAIAAAGDLDGDGIDDLVAGTPDGVVTVLRAAAEGVVAASTVDAGVPITALRASDTDGDARPDVLALGADGRIVVLASQPDGTLVAGVVAEVPGQPTDAVAADLDRAGRRDVLVAVPDHGGLVALLARGRELPDAATLEASPPASSIAIVDLEGDGRAEIVAAGLGGITVLEGNP